MNTTTSTSVYTSDGVNVDLGDRFSAYSAQVSRSTWNNSRYVKMIDYAAGGFRGPRGAEIINLPKGTTETGAADGVGTKVNLTDAALTHDTSGFDVGSMVLDDITRYGGCPLWMLNVLDVSSLGESEESETYQNCKKIIQGLKTCVDKAGVVLMGGETAELGTNVGSDNPAATVKYNWAGFARGAYHEAGIITGQDIEAGDVVVALRERGFRSNGISTVRRAFRFRYGDEWWNNPAAKRDIYLAAFPSTLYTPGLLAAQDWELGFKDRIQVNAIAHITGGGIVEKFAKDIVLPAGLSAELTALWPVPGIQRRVADWRQESGTVLSDLEFYRTFNGGNGMLVVLPPDCVELFISVMHRFGISARRAGRVLKPMGRPAVHLKSRYREGVMVTV